MDSLPLFLALDGFVTNPDNLELPNISLGGGLAAILNIVFVAAGVLAVVFIIIGGVKYILSGGDASGIKSAKETITYAIIGLIITLLAFGIVNFVTRIG